MKRILLIGAVIGASVLGIQIFKSFGRLQRRESEGNALGRLAAIRTAMSVYFGDHGGRYPADLGALVPKYLPRIEPAFRGAVLRHLPHGMVNGVQAMTSEEFAAGNFTDAGGWAYVTSGSTSPANGIGTLAINCTHTDIRGRVWTSF